MITLPTLYSNFIHVSRYARWRETDSRREMWEETIDRYLDFMCEEQCAGKVDSVTKSELRDAIGTLQVMPSMRCVMTAGPALVRDNIAGFGCSAIAVDNVAAFDELMYCLMCLHPDTEIIVKGGIKKISDITTQDLVKSLDISTGETIYVKPNLVLRNPTENSPKIRLTFSDGSSVVCTAYHLFMTKNRGWVKACDLLDSDDL